MDRYIYIYNIMGSVRNRDERTREEGICRVWSWVMVKRTRRLNREEIECLRAILRRISDLRVEQPIEKMRR